MLATHYNKEWSIVDGLFEANGPAVVWRTVLHQLYSAVQRDHVTGTTEQIRRLTEDNGSVTDSPCLIIIGCSLAVSN